MDPTPREDEPVTPAAQILSVTRALCTLAQPLRFLKGIGPKRAAELESIGLLTVEDLLFHLPFRYEDRRAITPIRGLGVGEVATCIGRLSAMRKHFNPRRRVQALSATLMDESGALGLFWYRAPAYLVERLTAGARLLVHGKVEIDARGAKRIVHPDFELLSDAGMPPEKIVPVYLHSAGVPLSLLRGWIAAALKDYGAYLPNLLPAPTMARQKLLPLPAAIADLHQPPAEANAEALNAFASVAHRSVIFEEFFYLQLGLGLRKRAGAALPGVRLASARRGLASAMRRLLPFKMTGAQERVLGEIDKDMNAGRAMQRLLQGDVGTGKTMVAWFATLRVLEGGYQVTWMAPTELLAEQHFRGIQRFAEELGIRAALLTGSMGARARKEILSKVEKGEIDFLIGTHALIQEGVRVPRLGLGVIDEQHRFGVLQRLSLRRLVAPDAVAAAAIPEPHMLLMSATPIPRSLAMVLYGDLDISILDELPPGRNGVATRLFYPNQRRAVYDIVIRELRQKHQAFIVYPLVEASEELGEIRDATRMAEKMRQGVFKDFGVGLVHGKMSNSERDEVMRSFRDGVTGVLVATTVVEVGIDIPNATVMVVEHAERFGLSQLHQLRGRIGRGSAPGVCLLINRAPQNQLAAERLRVMERQQDGFKIAEADLRLRGAGEFLGTRQSGIGDLRLANLIRDARILTQARNEARLYLELDPNLTRPESAALREVLLQRWGKRLQLGSVG
jgi:ATP-dependent DNA helicase RecG